MADHLASSLLRDDEPATSVVEHPDLGCTPAKNPGFPIIDDGLNILCGPLLNYKGMKTAGSELSMIWHGSVLVVAKPSSTQPVLKLKYLGVQSQRSQMSQSSLPLANDVDEPDNAYKGSTPGKSDACHMSEVSGVKLYSDPVKAFWRFAIHLTLQNHESNWQYVLENVQSTGRRIGSSVSRTFTVPSASQSMRIMFYSCNGFSVGTDEDEWSGPVLWNDVLRTHAQNPFHAMIGGGDQIYNDGVRVDGPLKAWTDIANPRKRRDYPFDEDLRAACDSYYFANYVRAYLPNRLKSSPHYTSIARGISKPL